MSVNLRGSRWWLIPVLAGFAVFLVVQFVLIIRAPGPTRDSAGWFLNSGRNVPIIGITLALGAAVVAFFRPVRFVDATTTFAAGATFAMLLTLFAIGPGNLFPIVIVIGTAVVAVAVSVGTAVGMAGRRIIRKHEG